MVKQVKLADIAQRLGVSVVTVSKALSGQKGVSEELRAKIKTLADEMGYVPIHMQQGERAKTYTIGVITFENYFKQFESFYWKMYQELATRAVKENCFTMLEVISAQDENSGVPSRLIDENRADGIIIIGKPRNEYLKILCQNRKKPMVFLDFYDNEQMIDSVISAGFYGAYQLTDYLIRKGHSRIAFVGTVLYTGSITDRYFGYRRALLENGIEYRDDWIIQDRDYEDGIIGLGYEFKLPEDMPTAFVCNNDVTAYALIKQLEQMGYKVPDDVSVVGYDDYLHPSYGESTITTYLVDTNEMARTALSCILKLIENLAVNTNIHVVNGRIIERSTVKDIR